MRRGMGKTLEKRVILILGLSSFFRLPYYLTIVFLFLLARHLLWLLCSPTLDRSISNGGLHFLLVRIWMRFFFSYSISCNFFFHVQLPFFASCLICVLVCFQVKCLCVWENIVPPRTINLTTAKLSSTLPPSSVPRLVIIFLLLFCCFCAFL